MPSSSNGSITMVINRRLGTRRRQRNPSAGVGKATGPHTMGTMRAIDRWEGAMRADSNSREDGSRASCLRTLMLLRRNGGVVRLVVRHPEQLNRSIGWTVGWKRRLACGPTKRLGRAPRQGGLGPDSRGLVWEIVQGDLKEGLEYRVEYRVCRSSRLSCQIPFLERPLPYITVRSARCLACHEAPCAAVAHHAV